MIKTENLTYADSNPMKSKEECIIYEQKQNELIIREQVSSQASHDETNLQRSAISEAINKNIELQNISDAVCQDECKTNEMTVKHDEQNHSSVSVVSNIKRKRGRPRKTKDNSIDQHTPKTSENESIVQDISDITEPTYMIRNRRHTNKIRDTTNESDESDTNKEDKSLVKKRGRPVGSRGRGQGQGRGRGRGRGRGGGIMHNSFVDSDEINTTADSVADIENGTISNSPNIEKNVSSNIF